MVLVKFKSCSKVVEVVVKVVVALVVIQVHRFGLEKAVAVERLEFLLFPS
jgi:hypothetical protein|tara:strand:- start:611 stop:760 length:150 start_codon:yes stop_codon:yes gene_type:complete